MRRRFSGYRRRVVALSLGPAAARHIVASETFEFRLVAGGSSINDIVFAFDETLNKVLKKGVVWTMSRLR